ncbi:MAG: AMP-binding protein, partial [Vampirovibrionia bacterium]
MITNIVELAIHNSSKNPSKAAIIHKNKSISYKELIEQIKSISQYLKEKGVQKGDKVLIFVPMSIKLYQILLAVFYSGATAVFVDAWTTKKRLKDVLKIADCKAFIGISKAHLLRLTTKELNNIPIKINVDLDKLKPSTTNDTEMNYTNASDIALITFTTGSTNIPKAAKRTHEFLFEQYMTLKETLKPQDNDIDLATLPIFALNNIANGITTILPDFNPSKPDIFKPQIIIQTINKYNITTTAGSPIFYEKLAKYCIDNKVTINSLKHIHLGGAPVFPELAELLIKAFNNTFILIVYGSTVAEPISMISANILA